MSTCKICCAAFWIINGLAVLSGVMFASVEPLTIALLIVGGFNIGCRLLCSSKKSCKDGQCPSKTA